MLLATWLGCLALEWFYQPGPHYDQIEPGLYLGGWVDAPPPGTTAVLNVSEFDDSFELEAYRWSRIRDSAPAPSLEWLEQQVDFVAEQRTAGRVTYVHCFQGVSRSALVMTAYLMQTHGWSRDAALEFIRQNRPQAKPIPAFMELLAEWEAKLAKRQRAE